MIFPKKCLHIEYDFDFLPNNPLCFYTTNSQKVHFSSNCSYNTGHFIDFFPKKVIFFSKCGCISSTMLTFLPNNPVCFYTKNSQEFHFSSNCDYHTGHFYWRFSQKCDFLLKMRLHIEHYFDFFFSSPFCARRALLAGLHFKYAPHTIPSMSSCSVHRALQVDPKTWWREAFFFFLLQKSLQLFIDSLMQSFLQYCWSPFGFST